LWIAAADNGSAITGYTVTASPGGATCHTASTSCAVTGLRNGVAYTFVVTATNAAGTGTASTPSAAVVPAGLPGAPTQPVAAARNASAIVSWEPAPDNGSPITGYTVTAEPGGATCSAGTGGNGCTVIGLTNGVAYTFTVTAINGVGTGMPSIPTAAVMPNASAIVISFETAPGADPRGSLAAVSGTGLLPGSRVHFTAHSDPIDLGSAVIDSFGRFASSATIPEDLAVGDHLIVVDALAADGSVLTRQAGFTVPGEGTGEIGGTATDAGTGTGTGTGGADGNTLVKTGVDARPLVLAGVLFVLVGTALTAVGRREGE
jgi:hypothetical protein